MTVLRTVLVLLVLFVCIVAIASLVGMVVGVAWSYAEWTHNLWLRALLH